MEALVHWFSQNLCTIYFSGGRSIYHFHDPDPGASEAGCLPLHF